MTLKITEPVKQVGVLNHWADQTEQRLAALEKSGSRTTSVASGAAASIAANGGTVATFKTIVSNYTIQKPDSYLLVNSPGAVNITLSATPAQSGQVWRIKNINTGLVTLTAQNGAAVENLPFVTLPLSNQSFDVAYDGHNFWIF